ncbi:MAG: hypothetical protein WC437_05525 [Patescibacteria group bacterium]|jgi:hypothetical protein
MCKSPQSDPNWDNQSSIEYAKLWLEQSKLMWGRIQIAYLLHAGVFAAWYATRHEANILSNLIAWGSAAFSILLLFVMFRDGDFLERIRTTANNPALKVGEVFWSGKFCGGVAIGLLIISDCILGFGFFK